MEPVGAGIVVASLLNGLRHGFDIDHVAAIGDITSAQSDRRRALLLSFVYAVGHAAIVLGLGLAAILLGASVPASVDAVMTKVVGGTLVVLGLYVIYSLVRHRGRARLLGRWQLLHSIWQRVHHEPVVIEHAHPHDHGSLHDHDHDHESTGPPVSDGAVLTAQKQHVHLHRHVGTLPTDPLPAYGPFATFGIGVLHGIGAETPTQVLLFATAAGVGTLLFGVGVLAAFVGGMLISNALVAGVFLLGTRAGMRMPVVYNGIALAIALFSIAVGISYLAS